MPDPIENDNKDVDNQMVDTDHHSTLEDEGRKGTISRIAEILKGGKSEPEPVVDPEPDTEPVDDGDIEDLDEPDVEPDDTEPSATGEEYEEVDPRFTEAARKYGWSDEQIVAYAEDHDDRDLVMLTGMMEKTQQPVDSDDVVDDTKESDPYADLLRQLEADSAVGGEAAKLLRSLVTDLRDTKAELAEVSGAQNEAKETQERAVWLGRLQAADEAFDKAAEEFPELGATKTLLRLPDGSLSPADDAVKVREQLFTMAGTLYSSGKTWTEAVKDALRWYRGGREDIVEARVLKKIKDGSKRVMPKRERRHQTRKFANEIEEKAAVVNEALRRHNVELPE
jgi:hypothetical protein